MAEYSFIGKGEVFMRIKGAASKLRPVGNVTELNIAINEDEKSLQDFQNAGGGKVNSLRRVQDAQVSMAMSDFQSENIGLAVFGNASAIVAGSVTGESVTGYLDGLIRLANVGPSSVVLTSDPAGTTYTEGVDYDIKTAGLYVPPGATFADAAALLVDYDYGAQQVVEALMNSAQDYELVFSGLNEAQSGKAVVVDLHRVKFGATSGLPLIGDDFGSLPLTGEALKDTTKGAGESAFFKWTAVE
jgi:hypothetical protein